MITVILLIHLLIAIALVLTILLQRSEGGGLGMGGGSTMGGLMTTRGTASMLTRITAILAACFMTSSILLAIFAGGAQPKRSIMDQAPITAPAPPSTPSVPLAK